MVLLPQNPCHPRHCKRGGPERSERWGCEAAVRGQKHHPPNGLVQSLLDLGDDEGLDHVTDFDVVELLDADSTLHSGSDFFRIVLVPLQRGDVASVNHDTVTDKTALGSLRDLSVPDKATGDSADLGDLEGLLDLGCACDLLLIDGLEQTLDTVLDIVDGVVEN